MKGAWLKMEFPRRQQILDLINEALKNIQGMGNRYQPTLAPVFVRARNNIELPVHRRDHRVLLLSTAQRCVTQAEKQVIAEIVGDAWVPGDDYSRLVRIRSICFQLKNILDESMQDVKRR